MIMANFLSNVVFRPIIMVFYQKWLRFYLDFCRKYNHDSDDRSSLERFIEKWRFRLFSGCIPDTVVNPPADSWKILPRAFPQSGSAWRKLVDDKNPTIKRGFPPRADPLRGKPLNVEANPVSHDLKVLAIEMAFSTYKPSFFKPQYIGGTHWKVWCPL